MSASSFWTVRWRTMFEWMTMARPSGAAACPIGVAKPEESMLRLVSRACVGCKHDAALTRIAEPRRSVAVAEPWGRTILLELAPTPLAANVVAQRLALFLAPDRVVLTLARRSRIDPHASRAEIDALPENW